MQCAGRSRVHFPAGAGIFLISLLSRLAVRPTILPIQWVPDVVFTGVKRPGREVDNASPTSVDMDEWSYTHIPYMPTWRAQGQV
jgi:hypothetical protein